MSEEQTQDFFEWDLEHDSLTQWRRTGVCNHCGQCCIRAAEITFHVADSTEIIPETGMYPEGFNDREGGDRVGSTGQWSEAYNAQGERRFFGDIRLEPREDAAPCSAHVDGKCLIHEEKGLICVVWPTTPSQVEPFDECSYTFEKIDEWKISEKYPDEWVQRLLEKNAE